MMKHNIVKHEKNEVPVPVPDSNLVILANVPEVLDHVSTGLASILGVA